jgi:uncharacterized coiled-coil protein SlyX
MFSCEQVSLPSVLPFAAAAAASVSPPPLPQHQSPMYDVHVIASMQATTAYLLERVSMLETRILHQQDIITRLSRFTGFAEYTKIQEQNKFVNIPLVREEQQHQNHNNDTITITTDKDTTDTTDTTDTDAMKRRKLVF